MIEMDYGRLTSGDFQNSIRKLLNLQLSGKTAVKVKRMVVALQKKLEIITQEHKVILDAYVILDEKNEPVLDKFGQPKIQEGKDKEFKVKADAFWETKFSVDHKKLTMEELHGQNFSGKELIDLEPVIADLGIA